MRSSLGKSMDKSDGSLAGCELEASNELLVSDRWEDPVPQNTVLA